MNLIVFSIIIGFLISLTYNYFSFFKLKNMLIPLFFDIIILSSLSYLSVNVLNNFEQNTILFILLLFLFIAVYLTYLLQLRDFIFLKFIDKQRIQELEKLFFENYSQRIKMYTNERIHTITVLRNKRQVLVPKIVFTNLDKKNICNVIALNLNTNKFYDLLFIALYFVPAIIFFYSITYTSGSTKTMLIILASALIFIIKRIFSSSKVSYNIKNLKNKVEKQELIQSIEEYYVYLSENLSKIQNTLNEHKMNKSIEAINKYL